MKKLACCSVLVGWLCGVAWGGVRINEVCADNGESLLTAGRAASDWIELYNDAGVAADLTGWYLTDSPTKLTQWQFPSGTTIPANGYLIVFADNSAQSVVANQLHANFALSKDGEYIALVRPDGTTVEDGFSFPAQLKDITIGRQHRDITLLPETAPVQYTIPNSAGNAPTNSGSGGLGFVQTQGSFNVRFYKMKANPDNITTAIARLADPNAWQAQPYVTTATSICFYRSGTATLFPSVAFPTGGLGDENFVIVVTGGIYVPSPGMWTFAVASDDGFRLTISGQGQNFMSEHPNGRGLGTTYGVFNFPVAGVYDVNLTMFQGGGGAALEFAVAQGSQSAWNTSTFKLVGASNSPVQLAGAFGALIGTDVGSVMKNINSRLDARYTFTLDATPSPQDTAALLVRFSDGFRATLNGTIIASSNMPPTLLYNSAATATRPVNDILVWRPFNIPAGLLQQGVNTLSIIALNNTVADGDFFIQPKIVQTTDALHLMYFRDPTPGAANGKGYNPPTPPVVASEPRGYKKQAINVSLTCAVPNTPIYYTTNGSTPSAANGTLYSTPLPISSTTVLRAAAVDPETVWQNVDTVTYLFLPDILTQGPNPLPGWPAAGTGSINGSRFVYGMDSTVVNNWRPQIYEGFTNEIPTLSVVTDLPNLFDPSKGIYVNSGNRGIGWERPMSLELIDPVRGSAKEFQIDAGIRIRGGYSRRNDNPKYSFRFHFRSIYGASKLNFPLFDSEGADLFDKVELRCSQNHSWVEGSDNECFVNDVTARYIMRDLGQPYTRSRFYHLYINGQYWGLYQTQERADADYGATYLGDSDSKHYDAIRTSTGSSGGVTDGNATAWNELNSRATGYSLANTANYNRLLGLNPDGSRNPTYPVLVDVTNLICRFFVTQLTRDGDSPISGGNNPNNQASLFNRVNTDGFKFFPHDAEWTFGCGGLGGGVADDITHWGLGYTDKPNPSTFHLALMNNAEYRKTFSALVQKHFYNDGALTPENNIARFQHHMAEIYNSVCCESARWGRSQNNNGSSRTRTTWLNTCNTITNNFIKNRNTYVLQQFRAKGWLAAVDAPVKRETGRVHPLGRVIHVTATNAFYYTLNGSDPLLPDGSLSLAAHGVLATGGGIPSQTFVPRGATWKFYDNGQEPPNNNGVSWKAPSFNATAWPQGPATLGFAGSATVNPVATTTKRYVNGVSGTQVTTTYFRHTFTVANVAQVSNLLADMLCDDGAVIYLNGVEVARYNMPVGTPTYSTYSSSNMGSPQQNTYYTYSLPTQYLQNGANVLAVEVHQSNDNSSDLYFDLSLTTEGEANASDYVAIFTAGEPKTVMARAFIGSQWSELAEITFEGRDVPPNPPPVGTNYGALRMSKLMHAPRNPTPQEVAAGGSGPANTDTSRDHYAWFELCNTDTEQALNLTGLTITNNITVNATALSGIILPPGGRIFLVKNIASFNARYPNNTRQAVEWSSGNISRSGGNTKQFFLVAPGGTPLYTVWYDGDNWYGGASKNTGVWLDAADLSAPTSVYTNRLETAWRLSTAQEAPLVPADQEQMPGGPAAPSDYSKIRVTRLMFAPRSPSTAEEAAFPSYENNHYAWLELANTGDTPINLRNYAVSNNIECVFGNVTLPPGGRYTVCKKKDGFDFRYPVGFAPNDSGRDRKNWDNGNIARRGGPDKPFDFYAPDGTLIYSLTYSDTWLDGGAYNTGLWLKLKDWDCPLNAMSDEASWTLEATLSTPTRLSEFTVSEVNFAPLDSRTYEQYIELLNPGYGVLDLSGVRVSGSVSFTFPAGTYLAPRQAIVITKLASEFNARYQDPLSPYFYPGINVAGNWAGDLPTSGEATLTLTAADNTAIGTLTYKASWHSRANGRGSSLEVAAPFDVPRGRNASQTLLSSAAAWQPSSLYRGSPGRIDNFKAVVINEVLSHSPEEYRGDWVELLNTADTSANLATLYLSDSWNDLLRMNLSGTLAPGGFATFYTDDGGFGISELGEPVILTEAVGGTILRFHDSVAVPAMERGETIGRFQITDGSYVFTELAAWTQNAPNSLPRIGPVVISELMIRPAAGKAQYIELTNITTNAVPLFHPSWPANTWKFSGITFSFPQGVTLQPHETILVVATNAAAFLNQYTGRAFPQGVRIFDQWAGGRLDSDGETIALMYPGDPELGGTVPYYRADWLTYTPDTPWPGLTRAASYEKYPVQAYGNDPAYWRNAPGGTPGYAGLDAENASRSILIQSAPDKPLEYGLGAPYAPWIDAATIEYLNGELPPGATYNPATHTFTWGQTTNGNYSFSVLVTDTLGGVSTQWVRIAVSDTVQDGHITVTPVTTDPGAGPGSDTQPIIDGTPKLGGLLGPYGPAAARTDTPLVLDGPVLTFTNYTAGPLKTQPSAKIAGWFYRDGSALAANTGFAQLTPAADDLTRIILTNAANQLQVNANSGELLLAFSTNSLCPPQGTRIPLDSTHLVEVNIGLTFDAWAAEDLTSLTDMQASGTKTAFICVNTDAPGLQNLKVAHGGRLGLWEMDYTGAGFSTAMTRDPATSALAPLHVALDTTYALTTQFRTLRKSEHPLPYPVTIFRVLVDGTPCVFADGFAFTEASTEDDLGDNTGGEWLLAACYHGAWNNPALTAAAADNASMNALSLQNSQEGGTLINRMSLATAAIEADALRGVWNIALPDADKAVLQYSDALGWWAYNYEFNHAAVTAGTFRVSVTNNAWAVNVFTNGTAATNPFTLAAFTADTPQNAVRPVTYTFDLTSIIEQIPDHGVKLALLAAIGEQNRDKFENWFRNKSGLRSAADITASTLARVLNAYLCNIAYDDWSDDLLKFVTPPAFNGNGTISAIVNIGVMNFAANRLDVNGVDIYLVGDTLGNLQPASYANVRLDPVPGDSTKMKLTTLQPSTTSGFLRIRVQP